MEILNAPIRGTSLALLESEGCTFQGTLYLPPKSAGKGYIERETSLALLEREGDIFQGLLCLPLKSGGFLWQIEVHQLEVVKVWEDPVRFGSNNWLWPNMNLV